MLVSEKAIFWLYDEDPDKESMETEPWDLMVLDGGRVLDCPDTVERMVLLLALLECLVSADSFLKKPSLLLPTADGVSPEGLGATTEPGRDFSLDT